LLNPVPRLSVVIHRIGSSCLKSDHLRENIIKIINDHVQSVNIFIVSALPTITDQFISLAREPDHSLRRKKLQQIYHDYRDKALAILPDEITVFESFLDNNFAALYRLIQHYPFSSDEIILQGEFLSSELLRLFFKQLFQGSIFIDAEMLIRIRSTDPELVINLHESSNNINQILVPRLKKSNVLIVPGFYGSTSSQRPVLLGRDGSDITASIIADGLASRSSIKIIFWKDTNGIYTSNPKFDPSAKLISRITHHDFVKRFTGKESVIHPMAAEIAANKRIKLVVRNFDKLDNNKKSIIVTEQ